MQVFERCQEGCCRAFDNASGSKQIVAVMKEGPCFCTNLRQRLWVVSQFASRATRLFAELV